MHIRIIGLNIFYLDEVLEFLIEHDIPAYHIPTECEDLVDVRISKAWLLELKIAGDEIEQILTLGLRNGNDTYTLCMNDLVRLEVI